MTTTPATEPTTPADVDVLIVGGGPAGLAAALTLGRSRRSVLVVDAGQPRNAPAAATHAFLTRDGTSPEELRAIGRKEVAGYGVTFHEGSAVGASRGDDGFGVTLDDGGQIAARRILLATGLVDHLPDVPGLAAHWGSDVVHCPYCHGWEVRDRRIGVLATSPAALHQVGLFRQLSSEVTLLTHTASPLDEDQLATLAAQDVSVTDGEVVEVLGERDALRGVRLADGRSIELQTLVVAPRFAGRDALLSDLGLALVDHPSGMGTHLLVDPMGHTEVPGVSAAGNLADPMAQVIAAAAQGNLAGAMMNADLVTEETRRALGHASGSEVDWDQMYAGEDGVTPTWSGRPNAALVLEVGDLAPGSALDVGCGEGADAIWLAERGWTVTALDPSGIALDRARTAASASGVDVRWIHAGLMTTEEELGSFDLVSAQYPGLWKTPDGGAVTALLDAVAPGGTLLVVHHEAPGDHRDQGHGHDHQTHDRPGASGAHRAGEHDGPTFDPSDYVMPADVAARLDEDWVVEIHEVRSRPELTEGRGAGHVNDIVLRARRR